MIRKPERHLFFSALVLLVAPLAVSQVQVAKHRWMDRKLSPDKRAEMVIEQMTLDEKISLVHGAGMVGFGPASDPSIVRSTSGFGGFVPGIERLGIPDLNMADLVSGVTGGAKRGRYSTPLPSALSLASSWDPKLAYQHGALAGREARDQGYNMALGPGVNLMREPRNGRNFEYQGEDPILAGKMASQFIQGVQSQGIIGNIKHFALNDQETGRSYGSANIDRRSMRETDLLAFEIAVKEAKPGTVMCAYNRINGEHACENSYTLNEVLKKAWGFKGWVISDWFGTHSTVKAALTGLDQEMPAGIYFADALKQAVESGEVPVSRLNSMVHRILRTQFAAGIIDDPPVPKSPDIFHGFEVAQRVAEQGVVLLKNAKGQLPLNASAIRSIAVIGSHADVGVLSGGGSAQVDPPGGNAVIPLHVPEDPIEAYLSLRVWHPSSPLKAIRAKAARARVQYNAGTDLVASAALAKTAEVAIVFVHQPALEGLDLPNLSLPDNQDQLVNAVASANPHTIVVLETGGPVTMPWIDKVNAVLEAWYPGIRGGEAIANILFGDVNPSAKLPVTFAASESDLPHLKVPAPQGKMPGLQESFLATLPPFDINYTEALKVGYKWFDAENKQPLFPFGYGLSYTSFAYSGLSATPDRVTFSVRNTGKRTGAEIAQLYVGLPASAQEPPRRLVAWEKVQLAPGESKTVSLALDPWLLSVFNVEKDRWELVPGDYKVYVGRSSRDIPLRGDFFIEKSLVIQ